MSVKFNIPARLHYHFLTEIVQYKQQVLMRICPPPGLTWRESKAYPLQLSHVHWLMLLFGIKIKNPGEVLGQISRLLIGDVKSFIGKYLQRIQGEQTFPLCEKYLFLKIYKTS